MSLKEELEELGWSPADLAARSGLKLTTIRACISNNRVSKRMRMVLDDGREDNGLQSAGGNNKTERREAVPEAPPSKAVGRIYCVPRNPYIRLVEFPDGSHGRFRCKPNLFKKVGQVVDLKYVEKDRWEVVK